MNRRIALLLGVALVGVAIVGQVFFRFQSTGESRPPAAVPIPALSIASTLERSPERVDSVLRAMAEAGQRIERESFDTKAVIDHVGRDPVALFDWVRDNTFWVPYPGALRGTTGVLMDHVGNSLDRALLLAELLRAAGHTVRLASGTLPPEQVHGLLSRVRPVPAAPVAPSPMTGSVADIERLAKEHGLDANLLTDQVRRLSERAETMAAELGRRVATQAAFLVSVVGTPPPTAGRRSMESSLADHWWVQRQDGSTWVDFDPLLPDAQAGVATAPLQRVFAYDKPSRAIPLPDAVVHLVTIRVIVEQWRNGGPTEHTALEYSFRPSEVIGQSIVFHNMPKDWRDEATVSAGEDFGRTLQSRAVAQKEWLPSLTVGGRVIEAASVSESGDLNPRPRQSNGTSGGGGGLLGGFDGLGGGTDEPSSTGQFTAQWVEYEIRVPGLPAQKRRRSIFDLREAKARTERGSPSLTVTDTDRRSRAVQLLGAIQILPLVAKPSPEFVLTQAIAGVLDSRDALSALAARLTANDEAGALLQARKITPMPGRLLDLALARFIWNSKSQDVFLDAPNLLTYRSTLDIDASGQLVTRTGFDIVGNSVGIRDGASADPFAVRIAQGVADTNAEALLAESAPIGNPGAVLSNSREPNKEWTVIRNQRELDAQAQQIPAGVRQQVGATVAAGNAVVIPRTATSDQWSWWQINPVSGETLGVGQLGWGQSMTEYAVRTAIGFGAGFVFAFDICVYRSPAISFKTLMATCGCAGLAGGATVGGTVAGAAPFVALMVFAGVLKEGLCA